MKDWTEFSVSTSEAARSIVEGASDWYKKRDVQDELERIARDVHDWLIRNKEAADRDGDSKSRSGPWLPVSGWDYTDDPTRLDLRRAGVRNRLYEHGLRRFLNRMVASELLSEDAYKCFDVVAAFEMKALHEELVGYRLSSIPAVQAKTVNLVDLRDRFNMSANTNTTKIRNGRLVVMTGFGLWSVRIDNDGNYAIRAGEVAMIFHRKVFAPVLRYFEPSLNGPLSKE